MEPRPENATSAILQAFHAFPIVAIGESHRNQQVHDFIVSFVNQPGFGQTVNDIVVEFGNAKYQEMVDHYIAGARITLSELRHACRDTVNILVWDAPVYKRFFRVVRAANLRHPERRVRVLLADPPIDWGSIERRDQWEQIAGTRDEFAANVIEHKVLSKHHRGLLIFGSGHVTRENAFDAFGPAAGRKPNPSDWRKITRDRSCWFGFTCLAGLRVISTRASRPGQRPRSRGSEEPGWKRPASAHRVNRPRSVKSPTLSFISVRHHA